MRFDRRSFLKKAMAGVTATGVGGLGVLNSKALNGAQASAASASGRDEERRKLLAEANFGLKKTLLFISHRFSTVRRANRILVLEDGQISETGTHDELIKLNGTYARLFKLQAKSYR